MARMPGVRWTLLPFVGLLLAALTWAQESTELTAAKALDQEIEKANDLPEAQRADAIEGFVRRIRVQPKVYRLALADNLAISAAEDSCSLRSRVRMPQLCRSS